MAGNLVIGTAVMLASGTLNEIAAGFAIGVETAGLLVTAGAIVMGYPIVGGAALLGAVQHIRAGTIAAARDGAVAEDVAEPWTDPGFIDAIVALQKRREARAVGDPVFFDRSPVCALALACRRAGRLEQALACLDLGLHVVVDKPVAPDAVATQAIRHRAIARRATRRKAPALMPPRQDVSTGWTQTGMAKSRVTKRSMP